MNDFTKFLNGEDIYVLVKSIKHGPTEIACDNYACSGCTSKSIETLPFLGRIVGFTLYEKTYKSSNFKGKKTPYIKIRSNDHTYNVRYEKDLVNGDYIRRSQDSLRLKNGGFVFIGDKNKCVDICVINDITKAKLLFKKG